MGQYNVEIKEEDHFNEPKKGVCELQIVFSDSITSTHQMKDEIVLRRTLYHGHTLITAEVLMTVKSWKVKSGVI